METHKTVAERIRPILQAMERSIDTARRSRVKEPAAPLPMKPAPPLALNASAQHTPIIGGIGSALRPQVKASAHTPQNHAYQPSHPIDAVVQHSSTHPLPVEGARLKARPKRLPPPSFTPFDQTAYRSQAS